MMGAAMSKRELSNLAGYTYQRLHAIDRDLPAGKKLFEPSAENPKKYDLAIFIQRWVKYNRESAQEETEELTVVKAQHELVKKQKTEIEVARMKGEYVELQAIDRLWSHIAATVRGRFCGLAKKLAPALVMIGDPDRIEEIIDRDVRDALNMIASTPLPGEAAEEEDGETDEEMTGDE